MLGVSTTSRGDDKSTISRFLSEYFLSTTPIGLHRKLLKGGVSNGPSKNPLSTSVFSSEVTMSGWSSAEWRFRQINDASGGLRMPLSKPSLRPVIRYFTKSGSGCRVSSFSKASILIGVEAQRPSQVCLLVSFLEQLNALWLGWWQNRHTWEKLHICLVQPFWELKLLHSSFPWTVTLRRPILSCVALPELDGWDVDDVKLPWKLFACDLWPL